MTDKVYGLVLALKRRIEYDNVFTSWSPRWLLLRLIVGGCKQEVRIREQDMMTFGKIGEYVSAEPFRPFRIKMASGQTVEIRHPEMILVGRTSVRVYTATGQDAAPAWHDVSLMLMETLEPITAPQTQSG